ncbi:MAG: hypothetical protein JWM28_3003 [Chitinophagaceae bacterium]|nr:hypothetical protein [Chitinophagaceae bacterium]
MIRNFLLFVTMINVFAVKAQNYHAIQGSPYAGSLGVHNNPASMLMTPFKWDVSILGVQGKSSTNLFTIYNYSLLSKPANSQYQINSGDKKRFAMLSFNVNLLNARIALNRKAAIAFGLNIKSTSNLSTSPYNFIDTLKSTGDFFKINNPEDIYSGKITSASWMEIYASYSRTVIDDDAKRINAGVTIKVNKGLSGARGELNNGSFQRTGDNRYHINGGGLDYLYSSNYDRWDKNNSAGSNISNFLRYTEGGISFDAGLEYLVKPNVVKVFGDEDDYYDYEWKLGLSLLDAGYTQYQYGNQSRHASNVKSGITNVQMDTKFDSTITSVAIFNDSVATMVDNFTGMAGGFKIINPMRMVLNIDRFVYKNFYVNAEISLNVPGSWLKKWYYVHEMNLLTVTPRWETAKFGVYLPIQVTNTRRFWIGGAFKAGPLLVGIHNWANLFAKNTIQNGGGYIALVIRNLKSISKKYDKRLNCPVL